MIHNMACFSESSFSLLKIKIFFNFNNIYVYLVDINNNMNIIYGKLENDEIIELINPNELEKVIQQIYKNLHNN